MFALYLAGPVEHRGTVGIRPNHLLAAILTLFQPGVEGAIMPIISGPLFGMAQPTFKRFRRAYLGTKGQ